LKLSALSCLTHLVLGGMVKVLQYSLPDIR
jgi:hypothetical protein